MKYKGITLKEGKDSEAELLIDVVPTREFEDEDEMEEFMYVIEESILEVFADYPEKVYTEIVCEDLLQVRCDAITFDLNGVILLTDIYRIVLMLLSDDIEVSVAVHVDGEEWFEREDGTTYNEDSVSLDEFLDNIEYEEDERWRKKTAT